MASNSFQSTYYQTHKDVFWPLCLERREEWKLNVKEIKICMFCQKMLQFVMLECWNHSTTRNYAVTYYKT